MSFSQFELECLDEHNRKRQQHGCPPLQLDRNMCNFAQEWANDLASSNTLQHRPNNRYGENLYMAGGMAVNGRMPVDSWYDEIKDYHSPTFTPQTGHFTQVVWKSSQKLGVAEAQSGNNTYVVANYDPPGNMMGSFPENVPDRY